MPANDSLFPNGQPDTMTRLRCLGYDAEGNRSGGLRLDAKVVEIPKGAVLLRLVRFPRNDTGEWWFTPFEYRRLCDRFAVSGAVLAQGRAGGRSALHGALVLLSEWYESTPGDELRWFRAVRLAEPVLALYGEGGVGIKKGFSGTLKPIRFDDGSSFRQLYLPELKGYLHALDPVRPWDYAETEHGLHNAAATFAAQRLPFE